VTLFEREDFVGGGAARWGRLPGLEHVASVPAWFERRLAELDVDIRLGHAANAAEVRETSPDVVIVATGSVYDPEGTSGFAPRAIEGVQGSPHHTVEDVIDGRVRLGGTVLVLDDEGMHTAVGVAEIAAAEGANVVYATRKLLPADALLFEGAAIQTRLRSAGIEVLTTTYVTGFAGNVATLHDLRTGERRELAIDAFVPAAMRVQIDTLADELDDLEHVYLVGDALAPRTLREATYEGHRFARLIGDDHMPRRSTELLYEPMNALRPAASLAEVRR
jgi:hypothetical protein